MEQKYKSLFTPWKVRDVEIKNRIVLCPMGGTSLFGWFELTGCKFDQEAARFFLERVQREYPVIWKNPNGKAKLCFVGCPHLSMEQLIQWTLRVEAGLNANGKKKVLIPTVFTTAPAVRKAFEQSEYGPRLAKTGVILGSICPLMYMNNPLCGSMNVITCSNKLRTYTTARFYTEDEILTKITKEGK